MALEDNIRNSIKEDLMKPSDRSEGFREAHAARRAESFVSTFNRYEGQALQGAFDLYTLLRERGDHPVVAMSETEEYEFYTGIFKGLVDREVTPADSFMFIQLIKHRDVYPQLVPIDIGKVAETIKMLDSDIRNYYSSEDHKKDAGSHMHDAAPLTAVLFRKDGQEDLDTFMRLYSDVRKTDKDSDPGEIYTLAARFMKDGAALQIYQVLRSLEGHQGARKDSEFAFRHQQYAPLVSSMAATGKMDHYRLLGTVEELSRRKIEPDRFTAEDIVSAYDRAQAANPQDRWISTYDVMNQLTGRR
jgi:hypothetical protein